MPNSSFLISYDLIDPGQDYADLTDAIKTIADGYSKPLESVWIILHPGPPATIRDALLPHIDSDDKLLIVKLTGEGAWRGLPVTTSDWLMKYL